MGRHLKCRNGQSETINDIEFTRVHELVVDHLFPMEHEHILEYAKLRNSKNSNHDST